MKKLLLVLVASLSVLVACTPAVDVPSTDPEERPNIVLIMTDDQTEWELDYMPHTQRLIADAGLEFTEGISPHPLCCPARAEILTGEFAHNNGVRHNRGEFGGHDAFMRSNSDDNLAVWMRDAGYQTAMVGKSLNAYTADSEQMDGWDHWNPMVKRVYSFTRTTFLNDGDPYVVPYATDGINEWSTAKVDEMSADGRPFFMWVSHIGPHDAYRKGWIPPVPAERHAHLDAPTYPVKLKPSYGTAAGVGKLDHVRHRRKFSDKEMEHWAAERYRSLQSIDEANRDLVAALERNDQLDNTVIVFISDNGYLLGEFGRKGKDLPYEPALQIPFLMRGPGIAPGTFTGEVATLVDLAPTFLDYAGNLEVVRGTGRIDGVSLRDAAERGGSLPDHVLIQAGSEDPKVNAGEGWTWRGVRGPQYTYARWHDGTEELYDRDADPHQLVNLAASRNLSADVRSELAAMRARLEQLGGCKGASECR